MGHNLPEIGDIVRRGQSPVLVTAIHAGHALRPELRPYLAASDDELRREEDPWTDVLASIGDQYFCRHNSRFEVDLNRSRERALATAPEHTWGQRLWGEAPPDSVLERSLSQHDAFYAMLRGWIEALIAEHGVALVLDLHSYNHRRAGADAPPADAEGNPDIDLGVTTLHHERFGSVVERFAAQLADTPAQGRSLDVRANVRYPDGGHFPEWIFAEYGDDVCTITLEYKKFYMDEWTGEGSLPVIADLRRGLARARNVATTELLRCRR